MGRKWATQKVDNLERRSYKGEILEDRWHKVIGAIKNLSIVWLVSLTCLESAAQLEIRDK